MVKGDDFIWLNLKGKLNANVIISIIIIINNSGKTNWFWKIDIITKLNRYIKKSTIMDIKKILRVYLDKLIHRFLFIRMLDDELNTMTEWLLHKQEGDIALNVGASFLTWCKEVLI